MAKIQQMKDFIDELFAHKLIQKHTFKLSSFTQDASEIKQVYTQLVKDQELKDQIAKQFKGSYNVSKDSVEVTAPAGNMKLLKFEF